MHGWRKVWVGAVVVAAGLCCLAGTSRAQTLIKYNEGPGLKLSDSLVFHGGGAVVMSYDSNVFYSKDGVSGSFVLMPMAHLDLATLPPQRLEGQPEGTQMLDFRLRFATGYRAYLSDNDNVKKQSNLDVDAGLALTINPHGKVKGSIGDEFVRTVTPQNQEGPGSYVRDHNVARARLDVAPGGGMLAFSVGYSFILDWWEKDLSGLGGSNPNMFAHSFELGVKWKFLPKTAVTLDVSEGLVSRPDLVVGGVHHPDSYPLRVWLGLVGQLTYNLSTILKAGYGNGFYQSATGRPNPANFNNALVMAQLRFQVAPTGALTLSFNRNFEDSLFSDFYTDNRVKLGYDHMFLSRLLVSVDTGYAYRQYSGLDPSVWGVSSRSDHLLEAHAAVSWRIRDWLFVAAGYDLSYVNADTAVSFAGQAYDPDYVKHILYLKAEASY